MLNLFRRKPSPAQLDELLAQRLKLFAMQDLDVLIDGLTGSERQSPPGIYFAGAAQKLAQGQKAAAVADLEQATRPEFSTWQRLSAWHVLRELDVQPPEDQAKVVLAIVLEEPLKEGRMILAAYQDYHVFYIGPDGRQSSWLKSEPPVANLIDKFLASGSPILQRAQPWRKPEPGPPPGGFARLSILTVAGLHFGQGPAKMLARDPLGGKVVQNANALIRALNNVTEVTK